MAYSGDAPAPGGPQEHDDWQEVTMQRHGKVDYRMARRALLREVRQGLRAVADVRDAHPELLRAAKWIG